jgi:hypothetical protein
MNSPDIAGFVERYAHHPPLASGTERDTVGNPGGHAFAARQFFQRDCESGLKRARDSHAATLRIEHECVSGF